jgi:hypothetical protein
MNKIMREVLPPRSYRLEAFSIVFGLIVLIAGCVNAVVSEPRVLAPQGPTGWDTQVSEAADVWNSALPCDAFAIGDGLPVRRYTTLEWRGLLTERGYYDGNEIAVKETTPEVERATLIHELGHAMGLQHSDDKASVMHPIVGATKELTAEDITNAGAEISCK